MADNGHSYLLHLCLSPVISVRMNMTGSYENRTLDVVDAVRDVILNDMR
jgi:2,4-dienoyl-CoA reductase-like NADH-dependent reductase (Old Yellow Enzyme family)